jgi:hypothetical protein
VILFKAKMQFQVVIMRYMEDVSWAENLDNVIIYNKGDKIKSKHEVVNLPNIGMCGASTFYHCLRNYENLADLTLFIQGHPWDGEIETQRNFQNTSEGLINLLNYYSYIPEGEVASVPARFQVLYNSYNQPFNWNQRHHGYFIRYTHNWKEFLDELVDPLKLINWKLPTRFYRNGHIAVKKEAILANPKNYYIKLLEYWKYDVPCLEWYAESVLGLMLNVGNNGELVNLNHDVVDYSNLDDYTKWCYELD